jgi:hypothetical protein
VSSLQYSNMKYHQMVNREYTFDEEEPSFHRYTARGHSYPLSHDRELPSAPGQSAYPPSRGQHLSRCCKFYLTRCDCLALADLSCSVVAVESGRFDAAVTMAGRVPTARAQEMSSANS